MPEQVDIMLENAETELPVERDIMSDLHRELEEVQRRLERQFPASYVEQAFQEFAEGMR